MGFFDKFKTAQDKNLHTRIAESEEYILTAKGKLVAAKDSIELKKQNVQKLIEEASVLHSNHDELDELKSKFDGLIG